MPVAISHGTEAEVQAQPRRDSPSRAGSSPQAGSSQVGLAQERSPHAESAWSDPRAVGRANDPAKALAAAPATDDGEREVKHATKASGYESTRPDVRACVPPASRRILDLGCSSGALGYALKRAQPECFVAGIEFDPGYAHEAEARLDRVFTMDLDELPEHTRVLAELGPFDCVIAADVLEHLRDPWRVLASAVSLLGEGGVAIVSLPNVRHWSVIRALVWHGSWPRRPAGIFDATHLRWFTASDARELLESAGLVDVEVSLQYWGGRMAGWRARVFDHVPAREFLAYQHLLVGRRRI